MVPEHFKSKSQNILYALCQGGMLKRFIFASKDRQIFGNYMFCLVIVMHCVSLDYEILLIIFNFRITFFLVEVKWQSYSFFPRRESWVFCLRHLQQLPAEVLCSEPLFVLGKKRKWFWKGKFFTRLFFFLVIERQSKNFYIL